MYVRLIFKQYSLLSLICSLSMLFLSCTQFFTNSLGTWAQRDQKDLIPTVSTSNAEDLVDQAANDPELSLEVLKGIDKAIQDAPEEKKTELRKIALDAASNASGVGPVIFENSGAIIDALDAEDEKSLQTVVSDAIAGLDKLDETSTTLASILPDPEQDPEAFDAFVSSASPDELANAAIIVLAAQAQASGDTSTYIESFNPDEESNTPAERLAVELAIAAVEQQELQGGSSDLSTLLESMNLN